MSKEKLKIGIFCTSSPLLRSPKLTDYAYLKSKGFNVYESSEVRLRNVHLAGFIEDRVNGIHSLLKDNSIDILMAYWGGANTNQILPYLDYELFKKYPKPIIGFSDTTALLLAVNKLSGIKTYMGPAGITFDKPEPFDYTFKYLDEVVVQQTKNVLIEDSSDYADDLYFLRKDSDHRIIEKNEGRKVYKSGKAEGEIIATNLQTLLTLAGTKYFPDLKDKVLFLEEAESEDTGMIHRFFTHLSQVVDLNTLSAVCIGKFAIQSGFKEGDTEKMLYDDVFKDVKIPVVYNLSFGHTDPLFTIPIGGRALIDTEKKELRLLQ